jgi:hypothetical protein
MVFHLGALIRLNEAGLLGRLDRVSSVSGGSITAACLGQNWNELGFGADGRAANLGLSVRVLPWVEGREMEVRRRSDLDDGHGGDGVGDRVHLIPTALLPDLRPFPRGY